MLSLRSKIISILASAVFLLVVPSFVYAEVATATSRFTTYDHVGTSIAVSPDGGADIEVRVHEQPENSDNIREFLIRTHHPFDLDTETYSNVSVLDEKSGTSYEISTTQLSPPDKNSWGKFYVSSDEKSSLKVEWYHSGTAKEHDWVIRYHVKRLVNSNSTENHIYWETSAVVDGIGTKQIEIRTSNATITLPYLSHPKEFSITTWDGANLKKGVAEKKDDYNYVFRYDSVLQAQAPVVQLNWSEDELHPYGYTIDQLYARSTPDGRQYFYDFISSIYTVNKDSTVDVSESQQYNFVGNYHVGWRSIVLKGVGAIDHIGVADGITGKPFIYSPKRLDKQDPTSWGKYTYFKENNHQNIEWYYNFSDTSHTFELTYRLHGAIGFFKDHDELYWNLATEYEVPIKHIEATVVLPEDVGSSSLSGYLYVNDLTPVKVNASNGKRIFFEKDFVRPREAVTLAASWPKGIIPYSSYLRDLVITTWGLIAGIISILAALVWVFYIQIYAVRKMGKNTIVPEYAPPQQLPPAEAEYLIKERLTPKAWPATVIDLAVRGYLKVEEKNSFALMNVIGAIAVLVLAGLITSVFYYAAHAQIHPYVFLVVILIVMLPKVVAMVRHKTIKDLFSNKDFRITKTEKNTDDLKQYERDFIGALFSRVNESTNSLNKFSSILKAPVPTEGAPALVSYITDLSSKATEYKNDHAASVQVFSTLAMKKNPMAARALYMKMNAIEQSFYSEVETETQAFTGSRVKWGNVLAVLSIVIVLGAALGMPLLLKFSSATSPQLGVLVFCVLLSGVIVMLGWFNPRLNEKGERLREDWLGFKMYLETAERYRLQNLTPDLFEKYLPYAMIFGIEKKWAKAFEGITTVQPSWYSGGSPGALVGGSSFSSSSFSAGAFASGFSASFASSFASSGGSGSSGGGGGGGGSGGGGGGGGGGGAG